MKAKDAASWLALKDLPFMHELRNTPLAQIGARYSNLHGNGRWNFVTPAFAIGAKSYNELNSAWHDNHLWQVPAVKA